MNGARPAAVPGWSVARFWTVALVLFILQAGLIWSFAERDHPAPPATPPLVALRALPHPMTQEQLATSLFAADPTLFQAPSAVGFSGRAWMRTPPPEYHAAEASTPDVSLPLSQSGWSPSLPSASGHHASTLSLNISPPVTPFEPAPVVSESARPSTSSMRLEGPVRDRTLVSPSPLLPPQPSLQLLANTVVQIAVDPAGQVMSACVITGSGLPPADTIALGLANRLRFAPDPSPRAQPVWGRAVFSWQTIEATAAK